MIDQFIALLTQIIITTIEKSGYIGIFLLMTAESALIPIPSEVTMPFSGYLVTVGSFNLSAVIFVGAVANLAGSVISYWLGFWSEEHIIRLWIKKYGKYLLISEHEYDRSERWFVKYGDSIVFFSRLIPVVRTFISLPAGISKMNFTKFCYLTFFGSLIWSAFLTLIGFTLGKNWSSIEVYYRKFEYLIIGIILIGGFIYLFRKIKRI